MMTNTKWTTKTLPKLRSILSEEKMIGFKKIGLIEIKTSRIPAYPKMN